MRTLRGQVDIPALPREAGTAWLAFLRAHAAVRREMSGRLKERQGLSLSAYEALLCLAQAPDGQLKRVELADHLLLTPSGISRLLDGLEREGYVAKGVCAADARVVYAVLTAGGRAKLHQAAAGHAADIRELFADRFSRAEIQGLGDLLGRLATEPGPGTCTPEV